jgi:N-acetyl-beta-hexosaminidase
LQIVAKNNRTLLSNAMITDSSKITWRGLTIDAAFTFQPHARYQKKLTLWLSRKKMNSHWHLVDDQG